MKLHRLLSGWILVLALAVMIAACNSGPASPLDAGREALKAGKTTEAIAALEKAVGNAPGSAEAHMLLGRAYLQANQKDQAQTRFTSGLSLDIKAVSFLDPQNADEHFLAGNVLANMGHLDEALAEYQTVVKLSPDRAGAYTNIGVIYYQKGAVNSQKEYLDDAITQYQKALSIEPKDAVTHYLLGAAYIQQDKVSDAEKEFQAALGSDPNLGQAYIGLGNVYLLNKDYDKAASTLEKATTLLPNSPEALCALGKTYVAQSRKADAVRVLNQCIQLNPPDPIKAEAQKIIQQLGTTP